MTVFRSTLLVLSNILSLACAASVQGQERLEQLDHTFVYVDAAHKAADPATRRGAVAQPFYIAKTETTNAQYARFLNAVAQTKDPMGLFNPLMSDHFWGGISRAQGADGLYSYAPKPGYEALPVTLVSWFDAVRYTNWLHFGRPKGQSGTLGVTEGDAQTGAYSTLGLGDGVVARNPGALFFLPTQNEWYKAAFGRPDGGWNLYPTGAEPANQPTDGKPSSTFLTTRPGWTAPFPHLTPGGYHQASPSGWGTFDQGGNVAEWVETRRGNSGVALGGSVFMDVTAQRSGYTDGEQAGTDLPTFGFRIATRADAPAAMAGSTDIAEPAQTEATHIPIFSILDQDFVHIAPNRTQYDPLTGRGLVLDEVLLARNETSNAHYAAFLNDVGAERVAQFCLFMPAMADGVAGGIIRRENDDGTVRFEPRDAQWAQRPATYLTWYAAVRFANWTHYRLTPDPSDDGGTEGNEATGAYDTTAFPPGCETTDTPQAQPETRNSGALAFLPSINEWYLAAFGERRGGEVAFFWRYPTRSNTPPPNHGPDAEANYLSKDKTLGEGAPFFTAPVDAYSEARSPSGTQQQAGNVWEWTETWRNRGNGRGWRGDEWTRGTAGGSFNYDAIGLNSRNIDPGAPAQSYPFYGMRLAASVALLNDAQRARLPQSQPAGLLEQLTVKRLDWEGRSSIFMRNIFVQHKYRVLLFQLLSYTVIGLCVLGLGVLALLWRRRNRRRKQR